MLQAADLLILSLWVAICAATPEFIWRGARLALSHADGSTLASALLFGLILAFCIEPALERLRNRLERHGHKKEDPHSLLLSACMGLVFAIVSICLHDSITAFLIGHAETSAERHLALINGLLIAVAWAIVPFCVSLAWATALTTSRPWRWAPFILAALSPILAGLAFSWGWRDITTTELPALAVLTAGWRQAQNGPDGFFPRAARRLGIIAPLWLAAAGLLSLAAHAVGLGQAALYSPSEFWIDARFYLGWAAGLLLVPGLPHIVQTAAND